MSTASAYLTVAGLGVDVVYKDIKNLHISVYPPVGRVRVAAPQRTDEDTIRLAIVQRLPWIKRQREQLQKAERQTEREMLSGETHYVWGQRYQLDVSRTAATTASRPRARRSGSLTPEGTDADGRLAALDRWYRRELKAAVPPLLEKWQPIIGVEADKVVVRRMKTKWGTCVAALPHHLAQPRAREEEPALPGVHRRPRADPPARARPRRALRRADGPVPARLASPSRRAQRGAAGRGVVDVTGAGHSSLWSDEPSGSRPVVIHGGCRDRRGRVLDDSLDPIALGLSGSWGSGKTSVLELVKQEVQNRSEAADTSVLVVSTQPWSYDPAVGPKESLIAEVLDALKGEIDPTAGEEAQNLLLKLTKRVKWAKAMKMAALTSITLQLPKIEDVLDLVSEDPADGETEPTERGLAQFREEFSELLESDGFGTSPRPGAGRRSRPLPARRRSSSRPLRLFACSSRPRDVLRDRGRRGPRGRRDPAAPRNAAERAGRRRDARRAVPAQDRADDDPDPGAEPVRHPGVPLLLLAEGSLEPASFAALVASTAAPPDKGGRLDDLALPTAWT